MDAVDILRICLRRWYAMAPVLLLAAGVSYQLVQAQETTYTAAASFGLVQPGLAGGAEAAPGRDPLGAEGSRLVGAALEAQLSSREAQAELGSDATRGWGPGEAENGSSYSVGIPLYETTYEVRAYGSDEQAVRAVVDRVIAAAPGIAEDLQRRVGVPVELRYEPFVLAPTQAEVVPSTSAKKLVVAVMGLGVLVGAAWSVLADQILRRRRAPAEGSAPRPPAGPAAPPAARAVTQQAKQPVEHQPSSGKPPIGRGEPAARR